MKEARFYESFEGGAAACGLCARGCAIQDGKTGACGVRKNIGGTLFTASYEKIAASAVDPIEKKPLFHVKPGAKCYSIATYGCNFKCSFCQNFELSQPPSEGKFSFENFPGRRTTPEEIVEDAAASGCETMAFTYSEPTIFYELAYDCCVLARKKGILTVFVTNGYIAERPLREIAPYLSAANVDLKSFSDDWYRRTCHARLAPVCDTIKLMRELGIFVEVTTLLIPEENDSDDELSRLASFIASVDAAVPWHVSAFHPDYKMLGRSATSAVQIERAIEIGKKAGLKYVYGGNARGRGFEDTVCPSCGKTLVSRRGYAILRSDLGKGNCPACGAKIEALL